MAYHFVGGLQTLHGIYPDLIASVALPNFTRFAGFIFCAQRHDGKWYLFDFTDPQNSAHMATGTNRNRNNVVKNNLLTLSPPFIDHLCETRPVP